MKKIQGCYVPHSDVYRELERLQVKMREFELRQFSLESISLLETVLTQIRQTQNLLTSKQVFLTGEEQ